jgi:hypothetical protein
MRYQPHENQIQGAGIRDWELRKYPSGMPLAAEG